MTKTEGKEMSTQYEPDLEVDRLLPGDRIERVSPKYGHVYTATVVSLEKNRWGEVSAVHLKIDSWDEFFKVDVVKILREDLRKMRWQLCANYKRKS